MINSSYPGISPPADAWTLKSQRIVQTLKCINAGGDKKTGEFHYVSF